MVDWGGIYEVIYLCESDTDMANAFRIAVGMPPVRRRSPRLGLLTVCPIRPTSQGARGYTSSRRPT